MRRTTFKLLGFACLGAGAIGAVLPVLPSTIFFILAAGCFARSSPALEHKLLSHPVFGPQIRAWRHHGAIPVKAKILAVAGMTAGFGLFYWLGNPAQWLIALVAVFMLGSAAFVVSRPSR